MRVLTFTPLRTNLRLKTGISPGSSQFAGIVDTLEGALGGPSVLVPNAAHERRKAYEDLGGDGYDLRLIVWQPERSDAAAPEIRFHVYGSAIAIAEVTFSALPEAGTELEAWSQDETERALGAVFARFSAFLDEVRARIAPRFLETAQAEQAMSFDVQRTSRALIIPEGEKAARGDLITHWLKNTIRPEDADEINAGERDLSMTWVNYVVIDRPPPPAPEGAPAPPDLTRLYIATMRIAQYFWSAQDWFNQETQQIVANALNEKNVKSAERKLLAGRARMQMLEVEYNALRAVLSRPKEKLLSEILASWSFDTLVANGERLIELSTARIGEITTRRAERASLFTDLILVGIGFLAIMEVLVNLMGFSREMMSRPALEYTDRNISFLMAFFAGIDTDWTLLGGFTVILLLLGVYLVLKRSQ